MLHHGCDESSSPLTLATALSHPPTPPPPPNHHPPLLYLQLRRRLGQRAVLQRPLVRAALKCCPNVRGGGGRLPSASCTSRRRAARRSNVRRSGGSTRLLGQSRAPEQRLGHDEHRGMHVAVPSGHRHGGGGGHPRPVPVLGVGLPLRVAERRPARQQRVVKLEDNLGTVRGKLVLKSFNTYMGYVKKFVGHTQGYGFSMSLTHRLKKACRSKRLNECPVDFWLRTEHLTTTGPPCSRTTPCRWWRCPRTTSPGARARATAPTSRRTSTPERAERHVGVRPLAQYKVTRGAGARTTRRGRRPSRAGGSATRTGSGTRRRAARGWDPRRLDRAQQLPRAVVEALEADVFDYFGYPLVADGGNPRGGGPTVGRSTARRSAPRPPPTTPSPTTTRSTSTRNRRHQGHGRR